jgi:hypothetical protein
MLIPNSYVLFHFATEWKGVLVEASATHIVFWAANRPNEFDIVLAGACDEEWDLHWVIKVQDQGAQAFLAFATESFRRGRSSQKRSYMRDAIVVKCKPLRTILAKVGSPFFFDFFSLDIEGAGYAAVRGIDFKQVSFGVIVVEADGHNPRKNVALRMQLESNG